MKYVLSTATFVAIWVVCKRPDVRPAPRLKALGALRTIVADALDRAVRVEAIRHPDWRSTSPELLYAFRGELVNIEGVARLIKDCPLVLDDDETVQNLGVITPLDETDAGPAFGYGMLAVKGAATAHSTSSLWIDLLALDREGGMKWRVMSGRRLAADDKCLGRVCPLRRLWRKSPPTRNRSNMSDDKPPRA